MNKINKQNKLKIFCINSQDKTVKNILKESIDNGSNILKILGFSHNNNSFKI